MDEHRRARGVAPVDEIARLLKERQQALLVRVVGQVHPQVLELVLVLEVVGALARGVEDIVDVGALEGVLVGGHLIVTNVEPVEHLDQVDLARVAVAVHRGHPYLDGRLGGRGRLLRKREEERAGGGRHGPSAEGRCRRPRSFCRCRAHVLIVDGPIGVRCSKCLVCVCPDEKKKG